MKGKRGEVPMALFIAAILIIAILLLGQQPQKTGDKEEEEEVTTIPSSGLFAFALTFKDKLATTDTPVIADYFIFDDKDRLVESGTASSSGTATEDVTFGKGKTYTIVAFNGTGSTAGYYYAKTDYTIGSAAKDQVVMHLFKEGMARITAFQDPTDLNSNISTGLGASKSFKILIEENVSSAAYQEPVIVVDYNSTAVNKIEMGNSEDIPCPTRLSAPLNGSGTSATNRKLKCFALDKKSFVNNGFLTSKDGSYEATGSITFESASTSATATHDGVWAKVEDQAMYQKPGADELSDFPIVMEDNANVDTGATGCGGSTACTSFLQYNG